MDVPGDRGRLSFFLSCEVPGRTGDSTPAPQRRVPGHRPSRGHIKDGTFTRINSSLLSLTPESAQTCSPERFENRRRWVGVYSRNRAGKWQKKGFRAVQFLTQIVELSRRKLGSDPSYELATENLGFLSKPAPRPEDKAPWGPWE